MKTPCWQIDEKLDFTWERELVFLDLSEGQAESGAPEALSDGERLYACQFDPEKQALAVCLDLHPGQKLELRPAAEPAPETGLQIEELPGVYCVRNRHLAVNLAAAAIVRDGGEDWLLDGPIVSVTGPDGVPRGASRIRLRKSSFFAHDRDSIARTNPARVNADEAAPAVAIELLAAGPVFARYRYTLTHPAGPEYCFTATIYAEYPVICLAEQCGLGRDGYLEILVSENFGCDHYFSGGIDRERAELVPLPPAAYRIGSLSPHHTACQAAYPWLGFVRSERPQGSFRGITATQSEPYRAAWVFTGHKPWDWDYPAEVTPQFYCQAGGKVSIQAPLRRGKRDWLWFVTDRDVLRREHKFACGGGTRQVSPFAVWHRKFNDLPLDWVRRLDLDSGGLTPGATSQAVLTPAELEARRQGIFKELASTLTPEISGNGLSELYARLVLNGDREAAVELGRQVKDWAEQRLALFLNSGFLSDQASAVAMRMAGPAAVYYEACVAADVFTPEEQERLKRALLLLAYATEADAIFPSHHNYQPPQHPRSVRNWAIQELYSDVLGTPNFQTDVYYNLGLFGAVFSKHPEAEKWLEGAAKQLDEQLDHHFHPGGVYEEALNYFTHLFHNLLSLASVLRRHGSRDFYADARFQAAMNTLVDYLGAPRQPTLEHILEPEKASGKAASRQRYWPAIGDTGHQCLEMPLTALIGHAAWEVREHNPELSNKLLAAWNECGKPFLGVHPPKFEFLYFQQLDPQPPKLELKSRHFVNTGVMLRADFGLESETSIFLRSGRATHHWGFEHGHFTMSTRGSQLIPDMGYHFEAEPGGKNAYAGASWLHSGLTFGPFDSGYTGMERRRSERKIVLGEDFDYVEVDIAINNVRPGSWRNVQPIEPVEYSRHFLFAHNRYIFVWDRVEHSIYPSQLRIPCLARSLSIEGQQLRFAGLDDVDLLVTIIQPEPAEVAEGLVNPLRYALLAQDCELDYVWVCQPLGAGETAFSITATPNVVCIAGRDLHGAEFQDWIVFAGGDAGAEVVIDHRSYYLDGRFAVVSADANGRETRLLEARALAEL